ncbi:MAG TPA: hypothetical protein DCM86_12685 [Verrucomicrobiales bacterium]|nr:hypothetical protein [Verrucomicrobiales bacterium]
MNWYYAKDGQQAGPVDELEFARLVLGGAINGSTLVWREGMPQWLPYEQVWTEGLPDWRAKPASTGSAELAATSPADAAAPPSMATPSMAKPSMASTTVCSVCNNPFPSDDLVRVEGRLVCAICKPTLLQRLKEGATIAPTDESLQELDPDTLVRLSADRSGSIDAMGCLSNGWRVFKNQVGLLLGGLVVAYLCMMAGGAIPMIGPCIGLVINGPLMAGMWIVFVRAVRGEDTSIGDVFSGFSSHWWPLVLVNLLTGLLSVLPFIPAGAMLLVKVMMNHGAQLQPSDWVLPGILALVALPFAMYLGVAWVFALPLVMDRGYGPWEAMNASRRIINRHLGAVLLLALLSILLFAGGVVLLCVGILFTAPVTLSMWASFYEEVCGTRVRSS